MSCLIYPATNHTIIGKESGHRIAIPEENIKDAFKYLPRTVINTTISRYAKAANIYKTLITNRIP